MATEKGSKKIGAGGAEAEGDSAALENQVRSREECHWLGGAQSLCSCLQVEVMLKQMVSMYSCVGVQ